jgi:hypothetical protein
VGLERFEPTTSGDISRPTSRKIPLFSRLDGFKNINMERMKAFRDNVINL